MSGDGNHGNQQTSPGSGQTSVQAASPPTPPPAVVPPAPPPVTQPARMSSLSRLRRRAATPEPASPLGMPLRRRWGRFAAGAFLALLGGWVSASLYVSAGSRTGVVALADDVGRYETIERDDLRSVRVAADPGVETVDADDIGRVVGRVAATDLVEGSLLTPNHLIAEDERIVQDDERIVGAELDATQAPRNLCSGIDVTVALAPIGDDPNPREYEGFLLSVGERDDDSGKRSVDIVVSEAVAPEVSDAARQDQLSINASQGC